jgi:heme/copper-type cytochrome/quinol oxidase subunit 1
MDGGARRVRRPGPWLVGALGVLLLVAGIVVFAFADATDFGWTSYTPLDADAYTSQLSLTFSDGSVLWTRQHALGAGLAVAGLLALARLGGWLLGRRSRRSTASVG